MKTIFPNPGELPLDLVGRCDGHYKCPKDAQGKRLGPLAAFAGTYRLDPSDPESEQRQLVGDEYVNFAKAEKHTPVLAHFGGILNAKLRQDEELLGLVMATTGFCGAPLGGNALACELARLNSKQYIYLEKEVIAPRVKGPQGRREVSQLIFDRHEPDPGGVYWIVEDICNNFSTTDALVELIMDFKAHVAGIICFLDRSMRTVRGSYTTKKQGIKLPLISVLDQEMMQYRQDDPEVVADLLRENGVVWKPKKKDEWALLKEAMRKYPVVA